MAINLAYLPDVSIFLIPNHTQIARVVGARPGLGLASQILGMPELAQIRPRPGCHTHGIDQIARPGPDPFAMGMPCPWHQPYCQAWARSVCQCYAIGILNYEFYALICFLLYIQCTRENFRCYVY